MDTQIASPISLRAYAKRRGVSVQAVSKAVKAGRLTASVARGEDGKLLGIADPEAADREWRAATDPTRMPAAAKERVSVPQSPAAPPPPGDDGDDAPPDSLSLSEESAKEKFWKAKIAELDFRERAGELVDAKAVTSQVTDTFSAVRARMLGVPARSKIALPHLSTADVGVIDSLVREALEAMADEVGSEAAVA